MNQFTEQPGEESNIMRVSVRAWLAILMCVTVCLMSGLGIDVTEPLYSGFLLGLGFYLGQKVGKPASPA